MFLKKSLLRCSFYPSSDYHYVILKRQQLSAMQITAKTSQGTNKILIQLNWEQTVFTSLSIPGRLVPKQNFIFLISLVLPERFLLPGLIVFNM